MKEEIKELRVNIDGIAQLTKELKPLLVINNKLQSRAIVEETPKGYIEETGGVVVKDNSKEIEKAVDSFYLGKSWLGKVMGEIGNANPYVSGYKTKEDIVPTQDVANHNDKVSSTYALDYPNMNHIEKVDFLRTEIGKLIPQLDWAKEYPVADGYSHWKKDEKIILAMRSAQDHLTEARFWLGFEMERIKNS